MSTKEYDFTAKDYSKVTRKSLTELWLQYKNVKTISQIIGKNIVHSKTLVKMIQPILLEDLILLAKDESLSYPDIADKLGIGLKALRNWMKIYSLEEKYDLPLRPSTKPVSKNYSEIDLIHEFLSLQSINNLKKSFHSSGTTITDKLTKVGFITSHSTINRKKVIHHVKRCGFNENLSNLLLEIIYGCLLGDGYIRNTSSITSYPYSINEYKEAIKNLHTLSKATTDLIKDNLMEYVDLYNKSAKIISSFPLGIFKYTANIKESEWLTYLTNLFENSGIRIYGGLKSGLNSSINGRVITSGPAYWLESTASVILGKIETEWYERNSVNEKKKIVPKTLTAITPNILLAWFIGDGSNSKGSIELATLNFSKEDNLYLVGLLQKSGIISKINEVKDKRSEKTYFRILIGRKQYENFMNFINLADPEFLQVCKCTFPWKFDKDLSFKDWKKISS